MIAHEPDPYGIKEYAYFTDGFEIDPDTEGFIDGIGPAVRDVADQVRAGRPPLELVPDLVEPAGAAMEIPQTPSAPVLLRVVRA